MAALDRFHCSSIETHAGSLSVKIPCIVVLLVTIE